MLPAPQCFRNVSIQAASLNQLNKNSAVSFRRGPSRNPVHCFIFLNAGFHRHDSGCGLTQIT